MKTGKWTAAASLAIAALLAVAPAFGINGHLKDGELLKKIQINVTTSAQVTEILGPPANIAKFPRREVEAWSYFVQQVEFSIEIDSKGVVRSVERIVQYGP
jgi:hypothetical protein